jgi:hypothetical protein
MISRARLAISEDTNAVSISATLHKLIMRSPQTLPLAMIVVQVPASRSVKDMVDEGRKPAQSKPKI